MSGLMRKIRWTGPTTSGGAHRQTAPDTEQPQRPIGLVKEVRLDISDLDATADITVRTVGAPVQNLLVNGNSNTDAVFRPRVPTHDTAGVALVYAATDPVSTEIILDGEHELEIVVAQGGAANNYTVDVVYEESVR